MKITLEFLKKHDACKEGIEFFKKELITAKKLIKCKKYKWAYWGITRILNKTNNIKFAIYVAESVVFLFEKKYPEDNRPQKAIEAAKNYLKDKNAAANAANAAANAANAAAKAAAKAAANAAYATYAAYAAYTAYAANAANAAANAAYAAANAADAAYAAAADVVNFENIKINILNYGLKLIEEQEQEQNNVS
jgi:hypothetical protein